MKAEYVNPFLQGAVLVFRDLLNEEIIRGKTSVKPDATPSHEIAILLNVTGSVQGQVVYSLNAETAYKLAEKLMPGTDRATIEKEYRDVLGELGNMITGNALNIFLNSKKDLDLSVPYVADTRSQRIDIPKRTALGLNLYSKPGLIELNIALE
ncbi:MAG: chemotaxis protein CheX [Spirochaetia bacterium]|nr:chemotaxis protein CheX [Spirochaetia bacterium]